jgi:hypothetical protein
VKPEIKMAPNHFGRPFGAILISGFTDHVRALTPELIGVLNARILKLQIWDKQCI